jgi:uncharacterized protein (DUF1778 family)
MESTQFTIKLSEEESKIIREAAKKVGLGHTSFTRMAALEKANVVLKS